MTNVRNMHSNQRMPSCYIHYNSHKHEVILWLWYCVVIVEGYTRHTSILIHFPVVINLKFLLFWFIMLLVEYRRSLLTIILATSSTSLSFQPSLNCPWFNTSDQRPQLKQNCKKNVFGSAAKHELQYSFK